ncbi:MAG: IS6 family transposase [Chlorobiaceae bacterium]|nr:IS6 family transposase [Chlorobiaceae bacterium]
MAKGIQRRKGFKKLDTIHMDEMHIKIKGEAFWLWRAVDKDGIELDILLQKMRNAKAAIRFFKRLLTHYCQIPRVLVTDKLKSYSKAKRILLPKTKHRAHKRLNNRCENSHQATREKERQFRKFKKPSLTQQFLDSMGKILNLFKVDRYKNTAQNYKLKLMNAFYVWEELIHSYLHCF